MEEVIALNKGETLPSDKFAAADEDVSENVSDQTDDNDLFESHVNNEDINTAETQNDQDTYESSNNKDYLTNWDKSKIDIPIFDLYKLYIRNYNEFDFFDILKIYEKEYPLKDEELLLFYILISMPNKIEFNTNNYDMCIKIENEVDKLLKSSELITNYKHLP